MSKNLSMALVILFSALCHGATPSKSESLTILTELKNINLSLPADAAPTISGTKLICVHIGVFANETQARLAKLDRAVNIAGLNQEEATELLLDANQSLRALTELCGLDLLSGAKIPVDQSLVSIAQVQPIMSVFRDSLSRLDAMLKN